MFLVVSQWEALPGHESQFLEIGKTMRAVLMSEKGVEMVRSFKSESGKVVVVHGYSDKAAYDSVVNNPNSAFMNAMQETRLEEHSRWISSERGETLD